MNVSREMIVEGSAQLSFKVLDRSEEVTNGGRKECKCGTSDFREISVL